MWRWIRTGIIEHMFAQVIEDLRRLLRELDERSLSGVEARGLLESFATIKHLASAGETIAARAVERTGTWKTSGVRSAAHLVAEATGVPVGQAVRTLETARRLETLPSTAEAFRRGELSEAKASEVARAACRDDRTELELLEAARTETVQALRERCRQTGARSLEEHEERARRVHARRGFRLWAQEGGTAFGGFLPNADAAELVARVRPHSEAAFAAARREGRREPQQAYWADGLMAAVREGAETAVADAGSSAGTRRRGRPRRPVRPTIVVHVDHAALTRGWPKEGERSEVPGIGEVPVSVIREWEQDAFLKVVVEEGSDIRVVAHRRRSPDARQRTAIDSRDQVCAVKGCGAREHLQYDHRQDYSRGGMTSVDQIDRLCPFHHRQKTTGGWRFVGPRANRRWVGPDVPDPPDP
jgi:hypothetical protein